MGVGAVLTVILEKIRQPAPVQDPAEHVAALLRDRLGISVYPVSLPDGTVGLVGPSGRLVALIDDQGAIILEGRKKTLFFASVDELAATLPKKKSQPSDAEGAVCEEPSMLGGILDYSEGTSGEADGPMCEDPSYGDVVDGYYDWENQQCVMYEDSGAQTQNAASAFSDSKPAGETQASSSKPAASGNVDTPPVIEGVSDVGVIATDAAEAGVGTFSGAQQARLSEVEAASPTDSHGLEVSTWSLPEAHIVGEASETPSYASARVFVSGNTDTEGVVAERGRHSFTGDVVQGRASEPTEARHSAGGFFFAQHGEAVRSETSRLAVSSNAVMHPNGSVGSGEVVREVAKDTSSAKERRFSHQLHGGGDAKRGDALAFSRSAPVDVSQDTGGVHLQPAVVSMAVFSRFDQDPEAGEVFQKGWPQIDIAYAPISRGSRHESWEREMHRVQPSPKGREPQDQGGQHGRQQDDQPDSFDEEEESFSA